MALNIVDLNKDHKETLQKVKDRFKEDFTTNLAVQKALELLQTFLDNEKKSK